MAKPVKQVIKLQIQAGKATPAPPIGTVLGPAGINIGDFCSQFNEQSKERAGEVVPVILTIYEDRTFSFVMKTPPASFLLRQAAGVDKGSGKNLLKKAGKVTVAAVREIAERKMEDLNARDVEAAMEIVKGTARSMGIEVGR
ncbi:MAG: 50S ribosomal protein L11 [Candidatus Kaiserbacteria bacterium]|nr:50S ribosomal protein L11 [Candidatus Kaiserbacteria bacterium]